MKPTYLLILSLHTTPSKIWAAKYLPAMIITSFPSVNVSKGPV